MVEPTGSSLVELFSDGYDEPFRVDLSELDRKPSEEGRTEALIRGVAAGLSRQGHAIRGFHGCITSNVLPGSGLSSSASIEILLGTIFNYLFNDGSISTTSLALAGQSAENRYFGKPCGLMDQIACAGGGIVTIDFRVADEPVVRQVKTTFGDSGSALVVVDTGGSHADLTPDYAAVPEEMRSVARFFGKELCRELDLHALLRAVPQLRSVVGDRAVLRCLHFFSDNERVDRQIRALVGGNFSEYLAAVNESGDSSWELLQNTYSPANPREQGVPLALAVSRLFLGGKGAVRIQGGGFAGTIQAYVPTDKADAYLRYMERFFGPGCATPIRIRTLGTTEIFQPTGKGNRM
jgi:galactokinase